MTNNNNNFASPNQKDDTIKINKENVKNSMQIKIGSFSVFEKISSKMKYGINTNMKD